MYRHGYTIRLSPAQGEVLLETIDHAVLRLEDSKKELGADESTTSDELLTTLASIREDIQLLLVTKIKIEEANKSGR